MIVTMMRMIEVATTTLIITIVVSEEEVQIFQLHFIPVMVSFPSCHVFAVIVFH